MLQWGQLAREPLLHFLIAGAALFALFNIVNADGSVEADEATIIVDDEALALQLQFQRRAFQPDQALARLAQMPPEERQRLIDSFVREEALYREAIALGLDEGDNIIRRRLAQKTEYLAQGFIELTLNAEEADVQAFFEQRREDYAVPSALTFTHVYFDADRRGAEQARADAESLAETLNADAIPFSQSVRYGDRFPFHLNYVGQSPEQIAAHFGRPMAEAVLALEPSDSVWAGPFRSIYGWHLVMLTRHEPARLPELDEVRLQLERDYRQEQLRTRTDEAVQAIIDQYEVVHDPSPPRAGTAQAAAGAQP